MIYKDFDLNELSQFALTKTMFDGKNPLETLLPKQEQPKIDSMVFFPGVLYTYSGGPIKKLAISTSQLMNYFLNRKYTQDINLVTHKEISSLVSYIKLLRIPRFDKQGKPIKLVSVGADYAEEIPFRTYYSPQKVDNILKDQNGAGILSLKVDVISNTGAYYKHQINLKLHYANVSMLGQDPYFKYILTTPTVDGNGKDVVYGLIFGWAKPYHMEEEEVLNAKVLYDMKTGVIMNLKKYDLSFNQDGSVVLSIDFIGSGEHYGEDSRSDVINTKYVERKNAAVNQELATAAALQEQKRSEAQAKLAFLGEIKKRVENETLQNILYDLKLKNANDQLKISVLDQVVGELGYSETDQVEDVIDDLNEQYKIENEKYEKFVNMKKDEAADYKYSDFMTSLLSEGRVYSAKLTIPMAKDNIIIEPIGPLSDSFALTGSSSIIDSEEKTSQYKFGWNGQGPARVQFSKAIKQARDSQEGGSSEAQIAALRAVSAPLSPSSENFSEAYFSYVFAGDIVSKCVELFYVGMDMDYDDFKVILATADVIKVNFAERTDKDGNIQITQITNDEDGELFTIDLATFPVSYNLFVAWFIKNVVAENKEGYLFKDFLKDFFNQVVLTSFENYFEWNKKFLPSTTNSYAVYKKSQDEVVELSYANLPYDLSEEKYSKNKQILDTNAIKDLFYNPSPTQTLNSFIPSDNENQKFSKYLFIYSSFGKIRLPRPTTQDYLYKASPVILANDGIFQFYVGATTGILRDIKFQPINSPTRLAAQVLNATNDVQGKPSNKTFNAVQRYDVNITCHGFQYFQPGQLIYVNTELIGFGDPSDTSSVARMFTLGGFYNIVKVSHDIEKNEFTTTLTAKFVDWGERKKGSSSGTGTQVNYGFTPPPAPKQP